MKERNIIELHGGRQAFDFDCGAQALQVLLACYGVEIRGDKRMKALGTGPDRGRHNRLLRNARVPRGSADRRVAEKREAFDRRGLSVIVLLQARADR